MITQMQSRPAEVPPELGLAMALDTAVKRGEMSLTAPGPGGMPIPTVVGKNAQQLGAGITGGMPQSPMMAQAPGISMAAQRSVQAQQPVTQAQLAQLMQSRGVAGLPAQNMRQFREGGIIGFSGQTGSTVPEAELSVNERIARELRKLYENIETGYMQRAGATPEQIAQKLGTAPPAAARESSIKGRSGIADLDIGPAQAPLPPAPPVPSPRPPAPRPPGAQPTGIAQFSARVGVDTTGVEQAGNESIIRATERENRMRDIAEQKERAMAGMPDLNQAGIAALQEARNRQRALFEEEQKDAARQRTLAVLAGVTGRDRGAYDRVVAQQMAARKAEVNADLMTQQAILKLQEAQQAKALGKFDRAQALEKEAATLMDAAEKNKLAAQRIEMDAATTRATVGAQQRGQEMVAQQAALDRASRERIAELQGPGETRTMQAMARLQQAINSSQLLKQLAERAKYDANAAAQYRDEEKRLILQYAPELLLMGGTTGGGGGSATRSAADKILSGG